MSTESKKPQTISSLKKQFKNAHIDALNKELERLKAENEQLKVDPRGVIAPFLTKFDEAVVQNNRLSVTLCALMKESGCSVTVKKSTVDSFIGHRLIVNLEPSESEDIYTFTYQAVPTTHQPTNQ